VIAGQLPPAIAARESPMRITGRRQVLTRKILQRTVISLGNQRQPAVPISFIEAQKASHPRQGLRIVRLLLQLLLGLFENLILEKDRRELAALFLRPVNQRRILRLRRRRL